MRDAYLIAKNELLVTIRNPYWLFRGLLQPIIYLVLFAPLLNGVAGVPGFPARNAIQFFAPGLLIMNALFSAGFEGFTLQDKVESGFLERLRVTPINRLSLALGFVLQSSATLVFQSLVLIVCSLAFGLRLDPAGALILLLLVVLIGVTMASISFTLALMTREGGILAGITNTFILPLLILSGVMLPISFGPPIIRTISRLDPFSYAVDAARALVNGALTNPSIPVAFTVFVLLAALALALFVRSMREAVA
ncbi:MAG TPA: ABC transporter permease [Candidatus Binatia bacterium]|nr:ABC transporter permease [Candidatus Binatia bacterium]